LAGLREEVVCLAVLGISAGGSLGRGFGEFGPRLAVIEGEEEAVPALVRDFVEEGVGIERCVDSVAVGRSFRQKFWHSPKRVFDFA